MTSRDDAPGRRFSVMVRDVAGSIGMRRLAWLAALTVVAAAAEGVGLLFLVPLLNLLGIAGSERVAGGVSGLFGGYLGLEVALLVYLLVVVVAAVVVRARSLAVTRLRLTYVDDLRQRLHASLLGMEWVAFARLRGADITHVAINEAGRAAQGLEFLLRLAAAAIEVPVLIAVAFGLSPAMTVGGMAIGGVAAALSLPLHRRAYAIGRATGAAHQALLRDLSDDISGMRVVRSHGAEEARHSRFGERMHAVRATQLAHQRSATMARAVTQVTAAACTAIGVAVAVHGLQLALADTLVLVAAFARLAATVLRLQDLWQTVLNALPAHTAVCDMLAVCRKAAEPLEEGASAPVLRGAIQLDGVGFRHRESGPAALDGISMAIPAGSVTAVVGPSGAGKSTLADLLLGLLAPDCGEVRVDGQRLDGAGRRAWRRRVGYVPQDSFLFHDSVRANLLLGAPDADEAALWRALERAAADGVVRGLPQGLDTLVGDRGTALSGGERQRVALARALLRDPDLLILDEATSALDGESEGRVLAALEGLRGRVTLVVVAHRASTVRWADRVVVLDGGRVMAEGTWDAVERSAGDLLARLHLTG